MAVEKRILVTGASGLLGRAVTRVLVAHRIPVLPIDRVPGRVETLNIERAELGDIHRLHQLASEGLAGVIHCGGLSGPMVARDEPSSMVQVNIVGTANMLELARVHGARRFIYASSATVYGETGASLIAEDSLPKPTSLYAASKLASEELVAAYSTQFGLEGASLRLSWIYGPRRTTDCAIRTMIEHAQAGRDINWDFGRNFPRQYMHVDDAAKALVQAYQADRLHQQIYNVSGGSRATLGEIGTIITNLLPGASISLGDGPDPLDVVQGPLDISAARRDLAYSPAIDLQTGIRSYAEWLSAASTAVPT